MTECKRLMAIAGTGGYLPKKILTNHDIAKFVDTTDEWIMQRVGVAERHIIAEDETVVDMAYHAAVEALQNAELLAEDLDLILVATSSYGHFFPAAACKLQQKLGIEKNIPAFDFNAACSGFVYGCSIADAYIRQGIYKNILLVGADAYSRLLDWQDRSTCVLFGDGAGAVVLTAQENPGFIKIHLSADGKYDQHLYCTNNTTPSQASKCLAMMGNETFKVAVKTLGDMLDTALLDTGISPHAIDYLVPHQANMRIIQAAAKRLDLPMSRVITTVGNHGNTVAASIPLALHYAIGAGKIKRGHVVLFEAFGAGFTWGSCLLRY